MVRKGFKGIDIEKIDLDFDNNKLIIDKTLIEIDNYWKIKSTMIEIRERKKTV
jgi:hypothetical protein